ncbi:Hsp20/alpha crystallin family protein [Fontivita pretiosa]|uniref:Hsp20/alpha crystallin family protein n=1 Tax=Fontivita pretiosa TaxID=2989684 RepID=UPI003D17C1C7
MLARLLNDFSPLTRLHNEMNRLLEDFFEDLPTVRSFGAGYPAVNLWEDADQAYLECELPGMSMDDVEVYVTGNEVTISGQRKIADHPQANWHRRERTSGRFSRTLSLPWEIDADKVQAKLQDGVLTVTLPKCESCKPKKVQVQAA